MVHLDINVSQTVLHDSAHKYVNAKIGALIATYNFRRLVATGIFGERVVNAHPMVVPINGVRQRDAGFFWSAGVRYNLTARSWLGLTIGSTIGDVILVTGGPNVQKYVRFDYTYRLF